MITLLSLLLVAAADVDPFASYERNNAQIQVKGQYTLEKGTIDYSFVNDDAIWRADALSTWGPGTTRKGQWRMSEGAELFVFEQKGLFGPEREPRVFEEQLLYDGHHAASRLTGNTGVQTFSRPHMVTRSAVGPFYCWNGSLPLALEEFRDVVPTKGEAEVAGHKLHVLIYHKDIERKGQKRWYELALYFDPERNFLPIYMRRIYSASGAEEEATVQERFVRAARKCSNGAYLPTEWCATRFEIDHFSTTFPDYSFRTSLRHSGPVFVSRFVLKNIEEITGPVGFARYDEGRILLPGGSVRQRGAADIISMKEILRLAEGRLEADAAKRQAPGR